MDFNEILSDRKTLDEKIYEFVNKFNDLVKDKEMKRVTVKKREMAMWFGYEIDDIVGYLPNHVRDKLRRHGLRVESYDEELAVVSKMGKRGDTS